MSHADADAALQQHRGAVEMYARLCCPDPEAASDLVTEAVGRAGTASIYYGARTETAWLPLLLAEVRRAAAAWAEEGPAEVLAPDFRRWYAELAGVFGSPGTMRAAEDASHVLQAFNSLTDRARYTVWHQVIEAEADAGGEAEAEAEAALDSLRDSYLRRLTDRAPGPECQHYSRMLGAVVRGTNQRTSEDLEQHLAGCHSCSTAHSDLLLITRPGPDRRGALAARLLLWGHDGYLAQRARVRSLLPVVVPDSQRLPPRRRRFPASATALVAVLATAAAAGVAAAIVPSLTADSGSGAAGPAGSSRAGSRTSAAGPSGTASGRPSAAASSSSSSRSAVASPSESPSTATADNEIALLSSATGQCLRIPDGTAAFDTKPVQADCDSSTAQRWKVLDIEGDAVKLRNAASSQCLGINSSPAKGIAVTQRPCTIGNQDQMWLLKVYPRSGFVVAVCKTDTTLQLGLQSTAKNSAVVLVGSGGGTAGQFALDDALR